MSFMLPAGPIHLEANLREPKKKLRGAVVVCHPHPVYGGTMDNRVVYRAAKAAAQAGFVALRFNFRGVGRSTGQFDHGIGEKEDVRSAIDWLGATYPALDLGVVGYSFGAWVGLQVGAADGRIRVMAGLGLPLDLYDFEFLVRSRKPAVYIVGTRDEFCSPESLNRFAGRIPGTASLRRIQGSDHFFSAHIETMETLVEEFLAAD